MKIRLSYIFPVLILIAGAILIYFVDKKQNEVDEIFLRNIPLIDLAEHVQYNTTAAHLWFEELMSGDSTINYENDFISKLDSSEYLLKNILFNSVKEDDNLNDYIKKTLRHLNNFRDIGNARITSLNNSIPDVDDTTILLLHQTGSGLDQQFDSVYTLIQSDMDEFKKIIENNLNNDINNIKSLGKFVLYIMGGTFIFLVIIMYFFIGNYERSKEKQLEKSKDDEINLKKISEFTENIIRGNYRIELKLEGNNEKLNNILLDMKKKIEEKENELNKLTLVASETENAVVITNGKGYTEWVNKAFTKTTGYNAEEVIGKKPGEILQGEKTDKETVKRISENLKKKIHFTEDILNYTKDGKPYWLRLNISPILDAKGEVIRFIAIETDITEKKLEEENQKKRDWINTGISKLNELTRTNLSLKEIYENFVKFLNEYLEIEQIILYIYDDFENVLKLSSSYLADDLKPEKVCVRPGEGYIGQAFKSNKKFFLNNIENYTSISTSTVKFIPKQILTIPVSYNEINNGVLEIASLSNLNSEKLEFIEQAVKNLAITLDIILKKQKTEKLLMESQILNEKLRAQEEELRVSNEELIEKSKMLQLSEEELKTRQEELSEANVQLEEKAQLLEEQNEAVRIKNTELEITKDALRDKIKEVEAASKFKSQFLANMSHELRTPLNSILILSNLLKENRNNGLTEKEIEYAKTIYKSGNDLLNLINEILDLSKIESKRLELEITKFSLDEISGDMNSLFEPVAMEKKINFNVINLYASENEMNSDKARIEQILKNLLSNAFKFTPENGNVTLEISKDSGKVIFKVKDSGIGIAKEKQSQIFEAFKQADGSINRKFGGTGLGLTISKQLSKLLGGDITVISEQGKGSIFSLIIPENLNEVKLDSEDRVYSTEKKIESALKKDSDAADKKNEEKINETNILVVEDSEEYIEQIKTFIDREDINLEFARTGDETEKKLSQKKFDIIILDLNLPDISGFELLKKIKTEEKHTKTPVIIYTGRSLTEKENMELSKLSRSIIIKTLNSYERLKDEIKSVVDNPEHKPDEKIEMYSSGILNNVLENKNVLLVDDDMRNIFALTNVLENNSMNVIVANDGREAVEKVKSSEKIDIILMDIMMPEMDGYEATKEIRKIPGFEKIPIIALTAKAMKGDREKCIEAGASDFIAKPVDIMKLISLMKIWLYN